MEWLRFGPMSLRMLLWCVVVGVIIGVLFDCASGFGRTVKRRVLFCLDMFLGPLFSLITFFSALVITDGELHPLLFAGVLVGFVVEHVTIGRWISKGVAWFIRAAKRCLRYAGRIGENGMKVALRFLKSRKSAKVRRKT